MNLITNCDVCVASYSCTKLSPVDLTIEVDYIAPDSNPVGGGMFINNATGKKEVTFTYLSDLIFSHCVVFIIMIHFIINVFLI